MFKYITAIIFALTSTAAYATGSVAGHEFNSWTRTCNNHGAYLHINIQFTDIQSVEAKYISRNASQKERDACNKNAHDVYQIVDGWGHVGNVGAASHWGVDLTLDLHRVDHFQEEFNDNRHRNGKKVIKFINDGLNNDLIVGENHNFQVQIPFIYAVVHGLSGYRNWDRAFDRGRELICEDAHKHRTGWGALACGELKKENFDSAAYEVANWYAYIKTVRVGGWTSDKKAEELLAGHLTRIYKWYGKGENISVKQVKKVAGLRQDASTFKPNFR